MQREKIYKRNYALKLLKKNMLKNKQYYKTNKIN